MPPLWSLCAACALALILLTALCYAYLLLTGRRSASSDRIRGKRVCLVIAHPDDECMFFGPVVRALAKPASHNQLYVLCLTTGDFYGQGALRTKELASSVRCLLAGCAPAADITCANEPELPDDPGHEWDGQVCSRVVSAYVAANAIDVVLTFDGRGVSGHANHCAVHRALRSLRLSESSPVQAVYSLATVPVPRKYLFLWDLLPSLLRPPRHGLLAVSSPADYALTFKAMLCHRSQLMWFRWLYLVSSRYMLINSLDRMD